MHIWPAIDLRNGKCVRLRQGDYAQETVFGEDPAAQAMQFVAQGADRLHLVDLDAARDGTLTNMASIEAILQAVDVPCQLGGGVRDDAAIERLLKLGLARLVVGTRALKDPDWFRAAVRKHPHKLALGIDARNGRVATHGWLDTSEVLATDLARQFTGEPLAAIVMTDIARDGMLSGPNYEALAEMQAASDSPVVASGGVSKADDVARLAELKLDGVIIGRALYEGTATLGDCIAAVREVTSR